ncbi:MAG: hypothetical protein J7L95_03285 [Prolixibacteraceae bacterium]|nr:hypothetical protein [Prolixibacteraceae bacterium]
MVLQTETKPDRTHPKPFTTNLPHLKALVDEIREAGKYVFRKDKNRLKGYSSGYWKKLHRKQSSNQDDVA